jgi:alpha-tubulin suppressor-like RCC1 family protein
MLANSKLALALSAGFIALLAGCGGGGGGGGNNTADQGNTDTSGGLPTATAAEDNTPTTPFVRQAQVSSVGNYDSRMVVTADGSVLVLGTSTHLLPPNTPIQGTAAVKINGLPAIASISGPATQGQNYDVGVRFIALSRTGQVWAWGSNALSQFDADKPKSYDQLTPKLMTNWGTAKDVITCTYGLSMILKADGSLRYSPGTLTYGGASALGTVPGLGKVSRIALGMEQGYFTCQFIAITDSGAAQAILIQRVTESDGYRFTATVTPVQGLPALQDVNCSSTHCLAQAQDGSAWAWGDNDHGQLGDLTFTGHTSPVEITELSPGSFKKLIASEGSSMAITSTGGMKLWGELPSAYAYKLSQSLPDDPWLPQGHYPAPLQFYADGVGIADVANVRSDDIYLWGRGGSLLMDNGDVYSWGRNSDGQLGDGTIGGTDINFGDDLVKALGIKLN